MSEEKKDLEIVSGNGKDLEISPVYEHIKGSISINKEKNKKIVIPKQKKEEEKKEDTNNN